MVEFVAFIISKTAPLYASVLSSDKSIENSLVNASLASPFVNPTLTLMPATI